MKTILVLVFIFGAAVAAPEIPQKHDERVIGAVVTANIGDFPWMASVMYNTSFLCGGALISQEWVLTTAECVDPYNASVSLMSVELGNLLTVSQPSTNHPVQNLMMHPGYPGILALTGTRMNHLNIALLKLTTPIAPTLFVYAIALPTLDQIPIGDHTDVTLSGWGKLYGGIATVLESVKLLTMTIDSCIDALGGNPSIEHDYNVCTAGFSSSSGLPSGGCTKDSGSPLVWMYAMKPLLAGIVSEGNCTTATTRLPTVYSSTFGNNRAWIRIVSGV